MQTLISDGSIGRTTTTKTTRVGANVHKRWVYWNQKNIEQKVFPKGTIGPLCVPPLCFGQNRLVSQGCARSCALTHGTTILLLPKCGIQNASGRNPRLLHLSNDFHEVFRPLPPALQCLGVDIVYRLGLRGYLARAVRRGAARRGTGEAAQGPG